MSSISKTYVNYDQYKSALKFLKETKAEQMRCLGHLIHTYYNIKDVDKNSDKNVLWNTSIIEDVWLYKYCKLPFVQDRLLGQYDVIDPIFDLINFESNCITVIAAESENVNINFTYEDNGVGWVLTDDDTILVYGTTLMHKTLYQIKETIKGFTREKFEGAIYLDFFGLSLKYENGKYYSKQNDEYTLEVDVFDCSEEYFKFPKLKHSYNENDFMKFRGELIYFATENEVYGLTSFKNWKEDEFKPTHLARYRVPNYITDIIHG